MSGVGEAFLIQSFVPQAHHFGKGVISLTKRFARAGEESDELSKQSKKQNRLLKKTAYSIRVLYGVERKGTAFDHDLADIMEDARKTMQDFQSEMGIVLERDSCVWRLKWVTVASYCKKLVQKLKELVRDLQSIEKVLRLGEAEKKRRTGAIVRGAVVGGIGGGIIGALVGSAVTGAKTGALVGGGIGFVLGICVGVAWGFWCYE